jgi:hypothetical protein
VIYWDLPDAFPQFSTTQTDKARRIDVIFFFMFKARLDFSTVWSRPGKNARSRLLAIEPSAPPRHAANEKQRRLDCNDREQAAGKTGEKAAILPLP